MDVCLPGGLQLGLMCGKLILKGLQTLNLYVSETALKWKFNGKNGKHKIKNKSEVLILRSVQVF